ncbi:hypothetical protein F383_05316 [Gossypium arboreum]|uniref:Uncharacterized protein n=1 Tax=Gossypium arboreum TaxID=29729 RepID=A0A0B0P2Q8_GOSAR|nr:hypothetical protein F383_05316 [Gossypium arboreum]
MSVANKTHCVSWSKCCKEQISLFGVEKSFLSAVAKSRILAQQHMQDLGRSNKPHIIGFKKPN